MQLSVAFSKHFSGFYYFQGELNKVLKLLSKLAKLIISNEPLSTLSTLVIVPDGHGSLLTSTMLNVQMQQSSWLIVIFGWADPV